MSIFPCKGNVEVCPVTKEDWDARAKIANCGYDDKIIYHCLSDNLGRKWEKCMEKTLIAEVPWCFGDNTPRNETYNDLGRDGPSLSLIIGIVAPIVLLVLAAAFIFLIIGIRRKRISSISERLIEDMIASKPLLTVKTDEIIRRIVSKGVSTLLKKDVKSILVIGGIGNLVSLTARSILETYAIRMQWKSKEYQFPEVPTNIEDETIIFVYGWFGSWHDDLCSQDDAMDVCAKLRDLLENSKLNIKVIIAMKSDTYSKYKDALTTNESLFCNEINITNEELLQDYLKYFKELKHNCSITECQCCNLNNTILCEGDDAMIGMPLKFEVISKYHDHGLLNGYVKSWDIKTAMLEHFKTLEMKEKPIYEWIMYICLKGHFSRSESFDKDLVKKVNFEIKRVSFDDHYGQLRRYVRVWFWDPQNVSTYDAQYVFWHPFIYICAFHYLNKKDNSIVMNYCNVNAILQLVRPSSWKPLSYIEVSAGGADVEPLRKRLRKLRLLNKYKNHPLLEDTEKNGQ